MPEKIYLTLQSRLAITLSGLSLNCILTNAKKKAEATILFCKPSGSKSKLRLNKYQLYWFQLN